MSTLLGSLNSRKTGSRPQPEHPVDAALWGLAQRLTEAQAEAVSAGPAEPTESVPERTTEFQHSAVRVVRLPQRGGGLPSVGRMSQRGGRNEVRPEGVPTKPAVQAANSRERKTTKRPSSKPRSSQPEPTIETPTARRAEFTILKGRTSPPPRRAEDSPTGIQRDRQESRVGDEPPSKSRSKGRKRNRRQQVGVTIRGWLALFALAAVAAAIALFAPPWF